MGGGDPKPAVAISGFDLQDRALARVRSCHQTQAASTKTQGEENGGEQVDLPTRLRMLDHKELLVSGVFRHSSRCDSHLLMSSFDRRCSARHQCRSYTPSMNHRSVKRQLAGLPVSSGGDVNHVVTLRRPCGRPAGKCLQNGLRSTRAGSVLFSTRNKFARARSGLGGCKGASEPVDADGQ